MLTRAGPALRGRGGGYDAPGILGVDIVLLRHLWGIFGTFLGTSLGWRSVPTRLSGLHDCDLLRGLHTSYMPSSSALKSCEDLMKALVRGVLLCDVGSGTKTDCLQ